MRTSVAPVALVALVALSTTCCQSVPDAPVPIVWDEQACSECHMHVGDHRFAAELATDDEVLVFDDPGCLFHYVSVHHSHVRRAWFRDSTRDAWLSKDEVAFVPAAQTPMGYGLGAVRRGTAGAVGWDEASRRALAGPRPAEGAM